VQSFRAFATLWRLLAKALGSATRFIFRGAQELDPTHQRDGIAFFLFILALNRISWYLVWLKQLGWPVLPIHFYMAALVA
jgi:hypothetical protein